MSVLGPFHEQQETDTHSICRSFTIKVDPCIGLWYSFAVCIISGG